ncbi:MAG: hypothetical protein GXP38_12065 [Chloroflexi bacterium]|nr:hypothetical protein [Chloroflexota bacterium]
MGRGPLPQKQLLTVRQLVIAIGIVAVLFFIIGYTGKVLKSGRVQEDYVRLQQSVQAEKERKAALLGALINSDSEPRVEEFARDEFNLVKPGDQPISPLIEEMAVISDTTEVVSTPEPTPENWQLWLALFRK